MRLFAGTLVRLRVPTILQQEAVECGAACLAMVLAYYGRWVGLEELRTQCGVNRDGTKASNIVRAARTFGLAAKGVSKGVAELAALPMPLIVFWNFNHFIVVEAMDAERVWVNDPAAGRRAMLRGEFERGFTGVALCFALTDQFEPKGSRPSLASVVMGHLRGVRKGLAYGLVGGIALLVPGLLVASFNRLFVDEMVIQKHWSWTAALVVAMVVTAVLKALLSWLNMLALARSQAALGGNLSVRHMWRLMSLPLGFFSQRFAGDIANRLTFVDQIAGQVSGGLIPALVGLVSILGYGIALFFLDPLLAAIAVGSGLLAFAVLAAAARGMEETARRKIHDEAKLYGITMQGLSMIDDLKASGTEGGFIARWAGAQARVLSAEQQGALRATLLGEASAMVMALAGVAVLVAGGLRIMDGALTIGALVAFQTLMVEFSHPLLGLVGFGGQLQSLHGLSERLSDIDHYPQPAPPPVVLSPPLGPVDSLITLDHVSFRYGPLAATVLDDVSLRIGPGSRVALVGRSGCGKSTLGRLMVGLVEPSAGAILVLGRPLDRWPPSQLRRTVAYVDQHVGLFEGSLRDNLTLWDPTVPEPRYVAAARDAQALKFISAQPRTFDSMLAQNGRNLSGGERQRLAIARALAAEPRLLVLDEATSALDPITEAEVMTAIRHRGCATVIIAHRLSTIRDCDTIIVLDQGRVVDGGTHDQLMAKGGLYRELVEN